METVAVGRTGLRVSRLCLGTMLFGTQCDEAAAKNARTASNRSMVPSFIAQRRCQRGAR